MAFFTQKVWVEWIEQALANGEYNYQDYKSLSDIEQIGSSKVYKALMKKDDAEIMVSMKFIGNKLSTREVVSELKLLRKIHLFNNENISKFYGVTKSENSDKKVTDPLKYMVILEYGDGGSLREYLQNNSENLLWAVRLKFAKQLCHGISFLHENNIIHRNLHSNNIIINQHNLKLKALGITCKMSESSNVSTNLQNFLAYVDPQYFNIPSYKSSGDKQAMLTKKSDVYSLGVLLWELTSGYLPFSLEEHSDLQKVIMEGLREKDMDGIDKDYIEIYKKCWQSDPNDRPEIQEVVSAIEKIDGGIDPSTEQDVKTTKQRRRFTITVEPPTPAPPAPTVKKPVKSSPVINKPINPAPPTASPKIANKKSNSTLMVPKTRSRSKSPSRSRSKSPMARNKSPARPEIKVIKEEEEEGVTTIKSTANKIESPGRPEIKVIKEEGTTTTASTTNKVKSPVTVKSENSAVSAIMIQNENLTRTKSPTSRSKSPLNTLIISESPRSLSPVSSLDSVEEQPLTRRSRPKSKSPLRKRSLSPLEEGKPRQSRPKSKSPLRILNRAKSPDFATARPRLPKRSASVSIPKGTPRLPRRTQTMMPQPSPKIVSPPRSISPPKKVAYKPVQRRYSTSYINSSMQINAQTFQSLGECYHDGRGTIKNKSKALQYFKLASDGGNVCGRNMLAFCFEMGLGVGSDHKKAFSLYKQAADAGYKLAKQNIAKCYQKGIGVTADSEAAAYWLEKANQE
ncbi:15690_t:CDS:2 [Funneliformis mosseae]|uniref:15690_t:CDS:1 n=1 Tax=Funneliformis mosseae TaxID=27381 RepID=A0A9N8VSF0_FUNMO|nr:15690_t:CDS:2 [Funneliformis mosseae]